MHMHADSEQQMTSSSCLNSDFFKLIGSFHHAPLYGPDNKIKLLVAQQVPVLSCNNTKVKPYFNPIAR